MEALAVREESALMPIMSIDTAIERYKTIVEYVQKLMHEDTDFGKIPGTTKNTLLKPGAEKLCTLFGLSKRFHLVEHIEDWEKPFFNYLYRCALYRGDVLISEADGSCNSWESKYRWRQGERKCPGCGKETIIKGKAEYGGGWLCFAKKGGCGAKFNETDERITGQQIGRVANPDIADQVNTLQKMAQKRAFIAATLLAVNASEFFTQDIEDFVDVHHEPAKTEAKPEPANTDEALRSDLFKQAEKIMAKLPKKQRDEHLTRLMTLPTNEVIAKVQELIEKVKDKAKPTEKASVASIQEELVKKREQIRSAIAKAGPATNDKFDAYMDKHYPEKKLDELGLDAVVQIYDDWVVPF